MARSGAGNGLASPNSTAASISARAAAAIPADAFSRGSEIPIAASDPTLFFRAATEMLCENVANQVVDGASPIYASTDSTGAIAKMVTDIMGYPPSDNHYAQAVQILQEHYTAIASTKGTGGGATAQFTWLANCAMPSSIQTPSIFIPTLPMMKGSKVVPPHRSAYRSLAVTIQPAPVIPARCANRGHG